MTIEQIRERQYHLKTMARTLRLLSLTASAIISVIILMLGYWINGEELALTSYRMGGTPNLFLLIEQLLPFIQLASLVFTISVIVLPIWAYTEIMFSNVDALELQIQTYLTTLQPIFFDLPPVKEAGTTLSNDRQYAPSSINRQAPYVPPNIPPPPPVRRQPDYPPMPPAQSERRLVTMSKRPFALRGVPNNQDRLNQDVATIFTKRGLKVQNDPQQPSVLHLYQAGKHIGVIVCRLTARADSVVTMDALQSAFELKSRYGVEQAYVITTGVFSAGSKPMAKTYKIRLMDGKQLENTLKQGSLSSSENLDDADWMRR
jgi:hypothetical protein